MLGCPPERSTKAAPHHSWMFRNGNNLLAPTAWKPSNPVVVLLETMHGCAEPVQLLSCCYTGQLRSALTRTTIHALETPAAIQQTDNVGVLHMLLSSRWIKFLAACPLERLRTANLFLLVHYGWLVALEPVPWWCPLLDDPFLQEWISGLGSGLYLLRRTKSRT